MWVLHPTRDGGPVALGRTGYNFKTTKKKLQSSSWRTIQWEIGMQLVQILKVYQSGVKVMHPTKQPNRRIKFFDDVKHAEFTKDALVMWGSEYIVEVAKKKRK